MKTPQIHIQTWLKSQKKLNGIFVRKRENIFWLTGFSGSFGIYIQTRKGQKYLISDSRYAEKAKKCAKKSGCEFLLFDPKTEGKLKKMFQRNFALEDSVSLAQKRSLRKLFSQVKFKPRNNVIEKLRRTKTDEEIEKIKIAQTQVDKVLLPFLKSNLKSGITEKELSFRLEIALRDNGKFGLSFPVIIAFGENSAIPHHNPSDRKLMKGDNILIDCGVKFEGYCSDITRNFGWVAVADEYLKKYAFLLKVQESILKQYKIGTKVKFLDQQCREELGNDSDFFTHSLGHGVGLEVHELPSVSQKSDSIPQKNDVVTCEPGVYYPGKFGIRIEDLVVVREQAVEILSKTTKELVVF